MLLGASNVTPGNASGNCHIVRGACGGRRTNSESNRGAEEKLIVTAAVADGGTPFNADSR